MHAAGNFAAPFRAGALLLTLLAMLAVVAACQDRRATQRYQETTPLPQARESTPRAATTPSTPFQERREMAVNRIAYIGSDGNVFTIKPDGTDSRRLTTTDLRAGPGVTSWPRYSRARSFMPRPPGPPTVRSWRYLASRLAKLALVSPWR